MQGEIMADAAKISEMLKGLADGIRLRHEVPGSLTLIGIARRGADLAARLATLLGLQEAATGTLDINLYRDDWTCLAASPRVGSSHIPGPIDGRNIILVDDVLYTGRTVRAALEALLDYGRPARVELLALIDRGHRELPIQPDYTGLGLATRREDQVNVLLAERDGEDAVLLERADLAKRRPGF